ncbi:MAG: DUF6600 domain-containing protein [Acidobacteriota bacterium]
MRVNRTALLALLVGVFAGAGCVQAAPYGGPAGAQSQYDPYSNQQVDPYNQQRNDGYYNDGYYQDQGPSVDVGFFYNELSPYGEWVRHPQYGWVWFPRNVSPGWRPYSLGRWVDSDYGWTWVSYEPFGWATYHYGRWAWDRQVGWLWVPGTDWGPAWVSWQQGDGYVGWAPLPPAVGFEVGVGIRIGGFNLSLGIAPHEYAFVEERRFLDSHINGYIVPEARNITIINNTTNITNYTVVNNRVINHGVPLDRIEQATGRSAQRLRVVTAPSPRNVGVQRDVVNVYRPTERNLETVRVAPRNNAGLPQAAPLPNRFEALRPTAKPPAGVLTREGTTPEAIPVAPRIAPVAVDERQFQRQQQELKANLDRQQQAVVRIQRQELAQAKAKADAQAVAQRHAAELQALQEQRQGAERRLQTRQQIERQAAQATAARANMSSRPPAKPAKPKQEKKDNKDNKNPGQSF